MPTASLDEILEKNFLLRKVRNLNCGFFNRVAYFKMNY